GLPHHLIDRAITAAAPRAFATPLLTYADIHPNERRTNAPATYYAEKYGHLFQDPTPFRVDPGMSGGYFRTGRGMRGMGLDPGQTCQVPKPGVPMVYPACPDDLNISRPGYDPAFDSGGSAYDVPGLVLPSEGDCTDHVTGVIDNGCVARNAV